jgi:ribosomal protein S25
MNEPAKRYQIKQSGMKKWKDISEKRVMEMLVERFEKLTPVINKMLHGEEIITPYETYRRIN